jgi:hypothetical protein
MKRFIVLAVGLSLGVAGVPSVAMAQETSAPVINADGSAVRSTADLNPSANADGPTVSYGDLESGPGTTVIALPVEDTVPASTDAAAAPAPAPAPTGDSGVEPAPGTTENLTATSGGATTLGNGEASAAPGTVTRDGVTSSSLLGPDGTYSVTDSPPSTVSLGDSAPAPIVEPAPAAATETTTGPETAEPVVADAPVATAMDQDGDNYTDALEGDLGLDPATADTDGDYVADGDELNLYSTNPTIADTDGDGSLDGVELFGQLTDPLLWDDGSAATSSDLAASSEPVATDNAGIIADDTGAAGLAAETGLDPRNPDSDGDGILDGDEVNRYGTDPESGDTDGDGLWDGDELFTVGTDPLLADTVNDGVADGEALA